MSRGLPLNVKLCLDKALDSALLSVETYNKPDVKFKSGGYIVLMCIYDWVQHTPFGTTWVAEGEDFASRACTLLDVSGKPLIDYKVYQVNPSVKFGHASAAVPDSTGLLRFGVLDGRGRVIIPFEYDDITIFSEWDSAATAYVERGIAEVKGKKYPFALRRGE